MQTLSILSAKLPPHVLQDVLGTIEEMNRTRDDRVRQLGEQAFERLLGLATPTQAPGSFTYRPSGAAK